MGHVHIVRSFASPSEGLTRTIRIHTPDAYDRDPLRRFPVLYMQDGQNVFAHPASARFETWCANRVHDELVAQGRIEPWIIVAVDHGATRFEEYTPWPEPRLGVAGRGDAYVRFVADHLRPEIDRHYRTRTGPEWTGIMGSSLGGLVSLHAGLTRPEVFGRIGALSPTVMWGLGRLFEAWREHTRHWSRIWLDVGTNERIHQQQLLLDYPREVPQFHRHLQALGYDPHELRLLVERGAVHDEAAWQRRLPEAFSWLLG